MKKYIKKPKKEEHKPSSRRETSSRKNSNSIPFENIKPRPIVPPVVSPNPILNLETPTYPIELLYDYWKTHAKTVENELRILFNVLFN